MNVFLALTGGGLLLSCAMSPALAQSADDSIDPAHMTDQQEAAQPAAPAPTMPLDEPANDASFSDAEVDSFASAALEMEDLRTDASLDDAAKQEMVPTVLAEAGIDAQTYSAIGEAMQTDPELARRVQLAATTLREEPEG